MRPREYGINTVLFRHAVGKILGDNGTEMECRALIFFKGLASPSELARCTGLTSGATTAMFDRPENARLIKRRPNPHDRRGRLIVLIPVGGLLPTFQFIRPWRLEDRQPFFEVFFWNTEGSLDRGCVSPYQAFH